MQSDTKFSSDLDIGMQPRIERFGLFELDLTKLELKRRGRGITLQQQPMMLLAYLVERSGAVLTQEDLQKVLWPDGIVVDYEFGIYSAINRLRRELGDSATQPQFIETVPKRGYRFIAHVDFDNGVVPAAAIPETSAGDDMAADPTGIANTNSIKWRWIFGGLGICAAMLLAGWMLGHRDSALKGDQNQLYRYTISLPEGETLVSLAISPAGDRLAYEAYGNGRHALYMRYLSEAFSREIAGSEDGRAPFFSPDGANLGFYTRGNIKVASASSVRVVTRISSDVDEWNAIWGPDGFIYFNGMIGDYEGIWRVKPSGGKPEPLVQVTPTDHGTSYPVVNQVLNSSGEGQMIFAINLGPNHRSLHVMDLKTRTVRELLPHGIGGEFLASGQMLYFDQNKLYAVPAQKDRVQVRGAAVELLHDVAPYMWARGKTAVSGNGTLVYVTKPPLPRRDLDWIERTGNVIRVPVPAAAYEQVEASPDGRDLLVVRQEEPFRWALWTYHIQTKSWEHLLDSNVPSLRAIWVENGRAVVAGAERENGDFPNLVRIRLDAPGEVERLTNQPSFAQVPQAWSAKAGALLFLEGVHPKTGSDVMVLSMGNPRKVLPLVTTAGWKRVASFSPDGKFFAYESGHADRSEVFVQAFDAAQQQAVGPPVSLASNGVHDPLWSADGASVFYLNSQNDLMRKDAMHPSKPAEMWIPKVPAFDGDWWTRRYSMTSDGRLLIIRNTDAGPEKRAEIQVVVNWFAELNRICSAAVR